MARTRRSARLASASTNADGASTTPRLGAVAEGEEETVELPTKKTNMAKSSPPKPTTPSHSTPIKLPMSEMHPSKVHQTMAPPSSGLRHGFVDINPDQKTRGVPSGAKQATPSKTPMASGFTFRVPRPSITGENDVGLGPEAKRMMDELREEASKIKAELAAKREQERLEEEAAFPDGRKYAKAKGKASRYSDVHMAEFKKMDSIANHASAYRCAPGRSTPFKGSLKRTQSKASLDEPESSSRKAPVSAKRVTRLTEKRQPEETAETAEAPAKRIRQRMEDDASTLRPISRDGSSIPAPKSVGGESMRKAIPRSQSLANLQTPTKASVARTTLLKTPTVTLVKSPSKTDIRPLARSPSKPELSGLARSPSKDSLIPSSSKKTLGGLTKSVTMSSLPAPQAIPKLVQTPGRFDRVKSILKRQFSSSKPKSSLPQPASAAPKTPGRTEKPLPSLPLTTPARQYDKHVEFTPDTKQAAMTQNSPSPIKSILPQPRSISKPPAVQFPSLDTVMSAKKSGGAAVSYPDLSAYKEEKSEDEEEASLHEALPESKPGTFTFRSDHTIRFGSTSPNGFGGSPGQVSLRQVRSSLAPTMSMPGGFPDDGESSPRKTNKENTDPELIAGIPHGMSNKKRSRAMWDDEEIKTGVPHGISNKKRHRASSDAEEDEQDEGVQRGAKKLRKNPPPSVLPRFACSSPVKKPSGGFFGTPSPQKKTSGISLSRLNMLARPKIRK